MFLRANKVPPTGSLNGHSLSQGSGDGGQPQRCPWGHVLSETLGGTLLASSEPQLVAICPWHFVAWCGVTLISASVLTF